MPLKFKLARYANWGFPSAGPRYADVLYLIVGKKCIFTGLTDNATSTINACEEIVEEIARIEGCGIRDLTFYDLQTHVTYGSKCPGEFEIDRILVKRSANDGPPEEGCLVIGSGYKWMPGWYPAKLPESLIEKFRPCIGQLGQKRTQDQAWQEIAKAYNLMRVIPELN